MAEPNHLFFFLGGHDLEMLTIRELLQAHAPTAFCDKELTWGARASDYRIEIAQALKAGKTPVLIELIDDLQLGEEVIIVDHHGPAAGADKPISLHQIFALLALPKEAWTRHMELVAANDRGHIKGMLEVNATKEEIITIRAADRAAQGITVNEEKEAEVSLQSLKSFLDGQLTVVDLPHSRTAAVADRLAPELGGPGYENLLIVSPDEINFFGSGENIRRLDSKFPRGWYGGSLPERGFWGIASDIPDVLPTLIRWLNEPS